MLRQRTVTPRRWLTAIAAVVLSAAIAGCAPPPPLLSPLAPQTLGHSVTARQQVTLHFDGHTRSMQVALKVAPHDLSLIGLTAIGQRLFTLSWHGNKAQLQSTVQSIARIDPARILADLQLAYWPLPALRQALGDNLRLQQYGTVRVLWRNDKLLWFAASDGMDRWHTPMTIYNARLGYRLTIQPLAFRVNK